MAMIMGAPVRRSKDAVPQGAGRVKGRFGAGGLGGRVLGADFG
jgi:hypothetical protein